MPTFHKYKCYLCGQIKYLPYNRAWVKYWCEAKERWTKLYRTK